MITLEYIKKHYTTATRNSTEHSELFMDAQIEKVERKIKNLVDLYTDGQIDKTEFAEFKQAYSTELADLKEQKKKLSEQQEVFESCMDDLTAVSQALAGMIDMSEIQLNRDFIDKAVTSINVADNRFIWNFNIRPNTTAVSNMCVDGNKKRPVICIDGEEIAEDSTGASDEASDLHILDTPESVKSSYLSNEILENPLFSKNLSLIHRLHKALRKVRPFVKRIVGLTGTPCSNGLMDLWAQFRLLDKGERLGKRIGQYRDAYFTPDWNGFTYSPRPGAEKQIYSKIADISISMKTTDHLKMPELVMTADSVELDEAAATVYKDMEQDMCLDFTRDSITAANAGVLCGKLTQLASGSLYTDGGSVMRIHSHKLDALEDLIEAQNGKPVLIAYWYKHERDSIMERFDCREIKTDADIADWNKGKIPVALIQPSSAGHGLNLQSGGSTIIWYTMPWSLELYQQTNARLWRQGQQSETVVIHHLVAAGTIDEDIMKVLEMKDKTQAAMMKAVKARVRE